LDVTVSAALVGWTTSAEDALRQIIIAAAGAATLAGCASNHGYYASACERDYQSNRTAAAAAGALIGAGAGAAVARNDAAGAAVGAVAGGVIGAQLAKRDDPCGYGFGGYSVGGRYGRWDERAGVWRR
jgi:hypothetical protein